MRGVIIAPVFQLVKIKPGRIIEDIPGVAVVLASFVCVLRLIF